MQLPEIIGFTASILSIVSFIPQVIKTLKTRSTKDLSLSMYLIFTLSQIFWLIYGILIHSLPVAITNAITAGLAGVVLFCKLKWS
jgi:MtN3 and saliva related transmembrane protein